MSSASILLARARSEAGLSARELARRARVPTSTVSRIESGRTDATVSMLERLVAAAGQRLEVTAGGWRMTPSIAELSDASEGGERIDWIRLRGFVDWMRLHPELLESMIASPPPRTSQRLDNLLAAIAEKSADDVGKPRPKWCSAIAPLDDPWRAHGTPRMTARAAREAPLQFAKRNIWLAEDNLWRKSA